MEKAGEAGKMGEEAEVGGATKEAEEDREMAAQGGDLPSVNRKDGKEEESAEPAKRARGRPKGTTKVKNGKNQKEARARSLDDYFMAREESRRREDGKTEEREKGDRKEKKTRDEEEETKQEEENERQEMEQEDRQVKGKETGREEEGEEDSLQEVTIRAIVASTPKTERERSNGKRETERLNHTGTTVTFNEESGASEVSEKVLGWLQNWEDRQNRRWEERMADLEELLRKEIGRKESTCKECVKKRNIEAERNEWRREAERCEGEAEELKKRLRRRDELLDEAAENGRKWKERAAWWKERAQEKGQTTEQEKGKKEEEKGRTPTSKASTRPERMTLAHDAQTSGGLGVLEGREGGGEDGWGPNPEK